MAEIYYEHEEVDEDGKRWFFINGSEGYRLDTWTKEEARAHFLSPKAEMERQIDFCRAWGFYED